MKQMIWRIITLLIMLTLFFTGTNVWAGSEKYAVKKNESIEKSISFADPAKPGFLTIDNIFGYIHAEGYNGNTIQIKVEKTIKAKSQERLETAQKEVKLDIANKGNDISIMVDGPFRSKDGCICWDSSKKGYIVRYDFFVKIPHKTSITLKTINEGDIKAFDIQGRCVLSNINEHIEAKNIKGDFDIKTVNGPIHIEHITGSGDAHTVNGPIEIDFVKNPANDCSFKTVNGKLNIKFQEGLSADFKLKTFNGKIFSDFESNYLPATQVKGERKNGKYVYKSNGFQGIRIGSGGPTIKMDTLNGNIYIAKND